MEPIPQHLSLITLGTEDLTAIRAFYARWGWVETEGAEATWCAFDLGGTLLSFYSMSELAREADATPRPRAEWGGTSGYIADPDGNRWELAAGGPNTAPSTLDA